MFALFFSHSCPCWISLTLTCTFLFYVYFLDIFVNGCSFFACQSFLFGLNYLDHTHFLYSNILYLSLIAMKEPNPAKLNPTCANDHKHPQLSVYSDATANSKKWSLLVGLLGTSMGSGGVACRCCIIFPGACVDIRPLHACVMWPNTFGVALSGK